MQADNQITTSNMKNNNIARNIFSVLFGLIFLYGLFSYFTISSVLLSAELVELQRIRSLLIIFISLFLTFQVELLTRLRK